MDPHAVEDEIKFQECRAFSTGTPIHGSLPDLKAPDQELRNHNDGGEVQRAPPKVMRDSTLLMYSAVRLPGRMPG